ncbi:MAG: hypothetical protein JXR19_05255 [Bacteroidia bacterium]
MSRSFDKKLKQLRLQHEIYSLLHEDNGVSSHFDYHVNLMSDDETVKLNLLTYNKRHDEYMLFHTTLGTSSIDCLQKMHNYLSNTVEGDDSSSFTIKWKKIGESQEHLSYFMADDKEEAIQKFLHEKNAEEYEYSCSLNPLS